MFATRGGTVCFYDLSESQMDQVGLDVVEDIEEHHAQEDDLNLPTGPRKLLRTCIDAGKLGVKTGEGFYPDYPKPAQH